MKALRSLFRCPRTRKFMSYGGCFAERERGERPIPPDNTRSTYKKYALGAHKMTWPDREDFQPMTTDANGDGSSMLARIRLVRDLVNGRYQKGERLLVARIANEYAFDCSSAVGVLADLHTLGMVTLSGPTSAFVRSARPKEMFEAYAIRAALEEIGGLSAAALLKRNTTVQQGAVDNMRVAVHNHDLDAYAEQDVTFHRSILEASQNDVLLRVWDSMIFDLRIRAAIGKVVSDLPEIVESHQPIVDALERGQGREAGLLLRNHAETFLQFVKKAERDSVFFHQDLEIAREVQRAFIPQQLPSIPGLNCETFYKPAHSIGGDYYDFFPLRNGTWGIAIGDVSGKGIGAALIMASLQASLRAQALQPHSDPLAMISHVNRLVHESSPVQFFASLFYAEYDPAARALTYVNAGLNPPFVVRCKDGHSRVFRLQPEGAPVGLFKNSGYNSRLFRLEDGDTLVACTDGIVEAESSNGELWGAQRLESLFSTCGRQTPQQLLNRILNEVSAFTDGAPQKDDMTLLVMGVRPEGCPAYGHWQI